MAKINIIGNECNQCNHQWIQRTSIDPGTCPACKSTKWNKNIPYQEKMTMFKKEPHANYKEYLINIKPLCEKCGYPSKDVDHIIPSCVGGSSKMENFQMLCNVCHCKKTRQDIYILKQLKKAKLVYSLGQNSFMTPITIPELIEEYKKRVKND